MSSEPTTDAEAEEAWGEPPSRKETDARYARYRAEGHEVFGVCLTPDDREADAWIAKCSCGDSSAFENGPPDADAAERPAVLLSFIDMRWWARGHRTAHGLDWQEWMPNVPLEKVKGDEYTREGHCVTLFAMPDALAVICSCALDDGGEPTEGVNAYKSEHESEVRQWADEHRVRHGLAPQEVLPPAWMMYSPPDEAE